MAVSDWSGASLPWVEELAALKERVGALFRRAEPRRQVGLLLEGLIGGAADVGGVTDRPPLREALEYALNGDTPIVWTLDRLGAGYAAHRNGCARLLRRDRPLREGRDFDDFGGIFPPERLRGQFGQRPGPMRRDDFPSPLALSDDRKGESPPDEIGPIPFDIQIGLIPAVAAMLRPDSSPHSQLFPGPVAFLRHSTSFDFGSYLQSMEHTGGALGNEFGLERVISSDPNFQRCSRSPSSRRLLAVARSDQPQHRESQRARIDLGSTVHGYALTSWVSARAPSATPSIWSGSVIYYLFSSENSAKAASTSPQRACSA